MTINRRPINIKASPVVYRQWCDAMALQAALDDKTWKVLGRKARANRILRAALKFHREYLVKALKREGIDFRQVLAEAALKRAGKPGETPAMPDLTRPPQIEE